MASSVRRARTALGPKLLFARLILALALALLSVPFASTASSGDTGSADSTSSSSTDAADPTASGDPTATDSPTDTASDTATDSPSDPPDDTATDTSSDTASPDPTEDPAADGTDPAVDSGDSTDTGTDLSTGSNTSVQSDQNTGRTPLFDRLGIQNLAPTGVAGVCDTNLGTGDVTNFQQNTREDTSGAWINGALNQQNSIYAEGDFVPQRTILKDLQPGENELVFTYDMTKSGLYAYDFVDHLAILDEPGASITWDAPAGVPPVPLPSYDNADGTATVVVHVTFQIPVGTDGNATIRWDGHIASELDYGPNMGAGTINGAPYHFSLETLNCASAGQQDNQLMAAAVLAGTLTIIKDAVPNSSTDFHFSIQPGGAASDFDLDDDADPTLPNTVTFRVPPGTFTMSELNIPAGWTLTGLTCINTGGNTTTSTSLGTATATANVVDDGNTTCTFTNSHAASIEVDKTWVVNGTPFANGNQPAYLSAALTITGPAGAGATAQPFGTPRTGYLEGEHAVFDETTSITNDLCTLDSSRVTMANGGSVDAALPYDATLTGGTNLYEITNTVTCEAGLTLVKNVANGPASADDWTLTASGPGGGISGTSGVSGNIEAESTYTLSESGGDVRYVQEGTWSCTNGVDGTDGQIEVHFGTSTTCTVTNATAKLILAKVVVNDDGGTAVPSDFTLTADPQPDGLETLNSIGSAGEAFWVTPGATYHLSETGPSGYSLASLNCGGQPATSVTLAAEETVTCTFTNDDSPGHLKLIKILDNGDTGSTVTTEDFTLTAEGPTTLSGQGAAEGDVPAGDYALSESGPEGYDAGSWECSGGSLDNDVVTVPNGGDVTCMITNTAISPTLTLLKTVDNGDTGGTAVDTDWTLIARGPAGISGAEGDAAVTGAAVPIGTYTLSEGDGPAGYEAGTWDCGDHPVTDGQVTIALDENVICEIVNTAIPSTFDVVKTSDPVDGSTVEPGDEVTYTITVTGNGEGVAILDEDVFDDLADVLDDATIVSGPTASSGTAIVNGTTIEWNLPVIAADGVYTMTYTVLVDADAFKATLRNVVTSPGSQSCPPGSDDPECVVIHHTPHWTLTKSSDPVSGSTVMPGDTVTYTLTAHNDSEADVIDATATDDLSDVLDNATLGDLPAGLSLSGTTLTWTLPSPLAPGATTTISYTVTVNPHEWNQTLHNVATPGQNSGDCVPAEGEDETCETHHVTPPVTTLVVKKVDFETGAALPGATFEAFRDREPVGTLGPEDKSLGPEVTDAAGLAKWHELLKGSYLVEEISPPPGYSLPSVTVMPVTIDDDNFVAMGEMAAIEFRDPAEGQLAIVAKQQFEKNAAGQWEPSDGKIGFGKQVKYVVKIAATGPKLFHDVTVTDYVPGYNPDDVTSTVKATLVPGSAQCLGFACTVTVGSDNLVTWSAGTVHDAAGTIEFVVKFPQAPFPTPYDANGIYKATLWNVGFLEWNEADTSSARISGGAGIARSAAVLPMIHHELRSNEVVISATKTKPATPPPHLPPTGASAHLLELGLAGAGVLGLGLLLLIRSRREATSS